VTLNFDPKAWHSQSVEFARANLMELWVQVSMMHWDQIGHDALIGRCVCMYVCMYISKYDMYVCMCVCLCMRCTYV